MMGQALDDVMGRMQQALKDQTAKLEEIETSRSTLMSNLTETKDTLTEADNIVRSKESALADKAKAFLDAKIVLREKKEAQHAGDIAAEGSTKLKSELDKVLEVDLKAVVEGELAD